MKLVKYTPWSVKIRHWKSIMCFFISVFYRFLSTRNSFQKMVLLKVIVKMTFTFSHFFLFFSSQKVFQATNILSKLNKTSCHLIAFLDSYSILLTLIDFWDPSFENQNKSPFVCIFWFIHITWSFSDWLAFDIHNAPLDFNDWKAKIKPSDFIHLYQVRHIFLSFLSHFQFHFSCAVFCLLFELTKLRSY